MFNKIDGLMAAEAQIKKETNTVFQADRTMILKAFFNLGLNPIMVMYISLSAQLIIFDTSMSKT